MDLLELLRIAGEIIAVGGAVYAAATAAIRVELRYMRRDIDRAQKTADEAHTRLNVAIARELGIDG